MTVSVHVLSTCIEQWEALAHLVSLRRMYWIERPESIRDGIGLELDTLIHSIYYLRVSLREKWMEGGSACGELVRSSWSSFVDLVCLYLKAPVARLQRSIFVDGEGPSSADWLMERMDHAEELMTMMLTEGCTARQRYLLRVLQDQLIEFRTGFLVRRRLMLSLHQLRMQQKKSCAQEVAARTLESRLLRRSASVPPNVEDMALVPCMCE